MPRTKIPPTFYTLAEHENIPGSVVAVAVAGDWLRDRVLAHCGLLFMDWKKADDAAEAVNDRFAAGGGIVPDVTNAAHMAGFTSKLKVDGRRLYIPLPDKEKSA